MNYQRKICLSKPTLIPHHNGGWNYVLKILYEFHCDEGVFADDLLDNAFGTRYEYHVSNRIIPYRQSWIGFFHHPLNIAPWYPKFFQLKPIFMISSDEFRESIKNCQGIFTFSKSMEQWYKENLPSIRVEHLWHPTKPPEKLFNLESFRNNPVPQLVNIGFFLRKLSSIFFINNNRYEKVILVNPSVYENLNNEIFYHRYNLDFSCVKFRSYLANDEYEELLTKNIVFLDLYDSCANNIIIECIARNTPILVNRQAAVVEYLGEKYPFYFTSLEEASNKLSNFNLIAETHEYLLELETKKFLTGDYFAESFYNSKIYRGL